MRKFDRRLGCGMWIVWLLLAVFAGEWLLLWLVIHTVSREHLILAVLTVVIVTIIVGCVAVYFRVQRRIR